VPNRGALPDGVRIFDTAPTVAALLGIQASPVWDGRDVLGPVTAVEG